MTTRTKLSITIYVLSAMMLLNVFSKPLHIPEPFQWVLIIGAFIPLGLTIYFIKRQKQEKLEPPASTEAAVRAVADTRQSAKKRLILMMVLGGCVGLCAPLWLPVTGTTLGWHGDLVCGIITAVVIWAILGFRLRRL
jgi:hypothetical protein